MTKLSDRLNTFSESQTLKMAKLTRELRANGEDIINLTLGEPDFQTPQHIKDAAKKAIDDNYSYYTPVVGYLDVREAICRKLKKQNGLDYTPEQIVISTGAKQSIANVILSTINPGDQVVVPSPFWVSYSEMIKLAGGIPVFIEATVEQNFKINAQQLENAITEKTTMLIFSSPCNPTGSIYSHDELQTFAEVLERHEKIWIVSDEIYEHLNYQGQTSSLASFSKIKERVAVINGLSKAYAMTGWRLGYLASNLELAKACDKIQGQFTSATSSISQRATIAALDGDFGPTLEMKAAYRERRDAVYKRLSNMPGVKTNLPDGAFYFFPDISFFFGKTDGTQTIQTAEDLCMYLLQEAKVSTVTGAAFGAKNNIRLSYSSSLDVLIKAMDRMEVALAKLH